MNAILILLIVLGIIGFLGTTALSFVQAYCVLTMLLKERKESDEQYRQAQERIERGGRQTNGRIDLHVNTPDENSFVNASDAEAFRFSNGQIQRVRYKDGQELR